MGSCTPIFAWTGWRPLSRLTRFAPTPTGAPLSPGRRKSLIIRITKKVFSSVLVRIVTPDKLCYFSAAMQTVLVPPAMVIPVHLRPGPALGLAQDGCTKPVEKGQSYDDIR